MRFLNLIRPMPRHNGTGGEPFPALLRVESAGFAAAISAWGDLEGRDRDVSSLTPRSAHRQPAGGTLRFAPATAQGLFGFLFGDRRRVSVPGAALRHLLFRPLSARRPRRTAAEPLWLPAGRRLLRSPARRPLLPHPAFRPTQSGPALHSFCPAAKTQVFSGSEIDHAAAPGGSRYADLQNAFVYREQIIPDCSCNGKDGRPPWGQYPGSTLSAIRLCGPATSSPRAITGASPTPTAASKRSGGAPSGQMNAPRSAHTCIVPGRPPRPSRAAPVTRRQTRKPPEDRSRGQIDSPLLGDR